MVEFGIDITSEDAKTIVHHKVAARCFLVMNADDAVAASRNFANYYRDLGDSPMHRRPGVGPNKGGMSGSAMNIDQVLSRLQVQYSIILRLPMSAFLMTIVFCRYRPNCKNRVILAQT